MRTSPLWLSLALVTGACTEAGPSAPVEQPTTIEDSTPPPEDIYAQKITEQVEAEINSSLPSLLQPVAIGYCAVLEGQLIIINPIVKTVYDTEQGVFFSTLMYNNGQGDLDDVQLEHGPYTYATETDNGVLSAHPEHLAEGSPALYPLLNVTPVELGRGRLGVLEAPSIPVDVVLVGDRAQMRNGLNNNEIVGGSIVVSKDVAQTMGDNALLLCDYANGQLHAG